MTFGKIICIEKIRILWTFRRFDHVVPKIWDTDIFESEQCSLVGVLNRTKNVQANKKCARKQNMCEGNVPICQNEGQMKAKCYLLWHIMVLLLLFTGIDMCGLYGRISSFLAVIHPNSFGLVWKILVSFLMNERKFKSLYLDPLFHSVVGSCRGRSRSKLH